MSEQLNILWLARHLPVPLNAGDRIYTARLVEAVARADARVHFLGLANPEYPALGAEQLDPAVEWEVIPGSPRSAPRAMFSRRPLVGARFGTAAFHRRMEELLQNRHYDAVVFDQYGLSWALPLVGHMRGKRKPAIIHIAHDFETDVTASIAQAYVGNPLRKLALTLNARRTARAERAFARASDIIAALTQHDCDRFRQIDARGTLLAIPPGYRGPRRPAREITASTPRRVALVGSYRWTAKQMNLSAFLATADGLLGEAGVELAIVGDVPSAFRDRWQGRLKAGRFLGFVDDLEAVLDDCRMGLVVEAIGGGFKLKVLDYVMTRTPVASLAPALSGQSPELTRHFVIADDPIALVREIIRMVDDLPRLNRMQDDAYRAAAALYDWDANARHLLGAIATALGRGP